VTNGPGLTFAAGDPHAGAQATPALDFAADGRLIGIAAAQATYAAQTAPGAATLQSTANVPYKAIEPTRATVASDGSVWTASNLSDKPKRVPQSRLVGFNPATGAISGQNGAFLGVRIDALADDGQVADDTKAPKATFSASFLQRHAVRGHSIWTGLRVRTSEGGQTVATLRLRGKIVGFGLITRYQAGRSTLEIGPNRSARTALERAARQHRRAVVHLTVHDWAGNTRVYDHVVTLSL
jgi:hypothetical protein